MKKLLFFFVISISTIISSLAQLQSPEQFLGYKIGTKYTAHHQLVAYFKHVAKEMPQNMKLTQYGLTNEGRPLYLAYVSTAENIGNLENIRTNNLRLALQNNDNIAGNTATPVIVWLSYNVHGNETSSTEASMLTLYALIDPSNAQTKQWLQNTVVIIDPCLNPDGRERYVNWYTSVIGREYNPVPYSREHVEPWPGGRSNHYYFDLNRDWAWQTQIESRQRVKQYNQWLPQVHVDFHEQSYNQPYYFAPAAEPYHEVITKLQRDFQKTIGRNHARYFDKNGWLYFTGERFDLFYPSYGDTYPIYNGSIGMTYEQGGIRAGLGVITAEGDTLTLVDRVLHYFTTSMSTIEISSKNAVELVNEFKKYFATDNAGQYKSYIIKNKPEDRERINALIQFFNNNNIEYGRASGSGSGYDYHTAKTVPFSISNDDIVVSGTQPKGAFVRVLFDPNPKLSDSITYDITSWALPFVYGIQAFASKQGFPVHDKRFTLPAIQNQLSDAYGYVIKWQGLQSAKAVAQLLKQGIRLRHGEAPFTTETQSFPAGSAIILKNGNEKFGIQLPAILSEICNKNNVEVAAVNTGMMDKGFDLGSTGVHLTKAPRVVLLSGKGTSSLSVGDIWHFMDQELQYPVTLVDADNAESIDWDKTDVLIMPDGFFNFLSAATGEKIAAWVRAGGKIIAFESAAMQLSKQKWSTVKLKSLNTDDSLNDKKDPYEPLKNFDNRERDQIPKMAVGPVIKVDVDNTHPLMFGYPKYYYSLLLNNDLFDFIQDGGWNVGVIKKESQLSGFVGYKLKPKLKDGLIFGVQDYGKGSVVYFTENVLFRNFWQNGKLMFCNALFLVGQR